MNEETFQSSWNVLHGTVKGDKHPENQDSCVAIPDLLERWAVLAVADGHGNAKSFRSAVGARFATMLARDRLMDFNEMATSEQSHLSALKHMAEEHLPRELTHDWAKAIHDHYAHKPFSEEELSNLSAKDQRAVEQNTLIAYGATWLSILVTQTYILYMQLGDGDILTVDSHGEVARPMPRDVRLIANETTSLCAPEAWRDFQVRFQPLSGPPPALILVSTDGYANSFSDKSGFLKVGSDLLSILRGEGIEKVKRDLPGWLEEASRTGSGDDVTLGVLWRREALLPDTTRETRFFGEMTSLEE